MMGWIGHQVIFGRAAAWQGAQWQAFCGQRGARALAACSLVELFVPAATFMDGAFMSSATPNAQSNLRSHSKLSAQPNVKSDDKSNAEPNIQPNKLNNKPSSNPSTPENSGDIAVQSTRDVSTHSDNPPNPPTPKPKKRWGRWLLGLLFALFVLMMVGLYLFLGSQTGTQWLLAKVAKEVGMEIDYERGNIRDGLWVNHLTLAATEDINVSAHDVYVKMGWRALMSRQLHLSAAHIDRLVIEDKTPPTGAPFEYEPVATPVALMVENADIKRMEIHVATLEPVIFHEIRVARASWQETNIHVYDGRLGIDEAVQLEAVNGKIRLADDYPLDASARLTVHALSDVYFEPMQLEVGGSLKRTQGQVFGRYNKSALTGSFVVQSLEDDAPFWADVRFDSLSVPYVSEQNITLKDGRVFAVGGLSGAELRFNTQLDALDVPTGHYHGRAYVHGGGMTIDTLYAHTDEGLLHANGVMDWANAFFIKTDIKSDHYQLQTVLPDELQSYKDYLPKVLNGRVAFAFGLDDGADNTWYEVGLKQNDGERIDAKIRQKNLSARQVRQGVEHNPHPWHIHATWQQLVRPHLPDLGALNSPSGQVDLVVGDGIDIDASANIHTLLSLPKGDYQAQLSLLGDDIRLKSSHYQGEVGALSADGMIYLAQAARPLSWRLAVKADTLKPNAYLGANATPVETLTGRVHTKGKLTQVDGDMRIDVALSQADIQLSLDKRNKQTAVISGDANSHVRLQGSDLKHMALSFDGRLKTRGINDGMADSQLSLKAAGDLANIDIAKLTLDNTAGHLSVAGQLQLKDAITWQLHARADHLNAQAFVPEVPIVFSGDVSSTGRYKAGVLSQLTANVNGDVLSSDAPIPTGKLSTNIVGAQDKYTINRLDYAGQAGKLNATGWLDLSRGMALGVQAGFDELNLGQFVKGYQSQLGGVLAADLEQRGNEWWVDVSSLDVTGQVNGETFLANGKLSAHVDLPSDLQRYWRALKQNTKASFNLDAITGQFTTSLPHGLSQLGRQAHELQYDLARQDADLRRVIKSLKAEALNVQYGDNRVAINGDEARLGINVRAEDISQFLKGVRGSVTGGLMVEGGDEVLPTIYSDLQLANISMPSFAARDASIVGRVVNLGNGDSAFVMEANRVVVATQSLRHVRLNIQGTQGHHDLSLAASNNELQLHARLQGGLDGNRYQAVLSEGRLQTRQGVLNQRQPAEIAYAIDTGRLQVAAHCWQSLSATGGSDGRRGVLCLQDTLKFSPVDGHVNLVVQDLDTAVFTPMLPSDLSWRSRLNGKVEATWGQNTPNINVVLYSDNGSVGLRNEGLPDTTLPYDRVSFIMQTVPSGLKVRTDIHLDHGGGGYADVLINPYQDDKPIAGALVLDDLNLTVLRPFFPAMQRLEGQVAVAGGIGGTLRKPLFYGNATLTGGRIALNDAPIHLSDIEMMVSIRGMQASLVGDFKSGTGVGKLTGEADWQEALQAKFSVQGDKLVISSPPSLSAEVSPDLEIILRPTQKYVHVQGVVSVPKAIIRPPEATDSVISESADVTVIDRRVTGNVAGILAPVAPWSINADIGLDLGDEVLFRGFGATLPLAGALHLTQSGQGALQARGVIQVSERTKVDAIGQNLELNYAQIRFNGDVMNPTLSIEAQREIDSHTVGVRVTGKLENPTIRVFNDAGLTETQAMNALVTGSIDSDGTTQVSEEGFRARVTNSLAAAGLSLGLKGTHAITNQIGRALGFESLTVDASGSSADTNVNITGYITPDLYIRYGVGVFNAESQLSMRYQLTRRIYIEATSAIENVVDVVYRWRF